MAILDNSSSTPWNKTLTIEKQSGAKVTLATATKYVDENIELTFNVQTATPTFTGGGLSSKAADLSTQTNITTNTSTNNSGVSIVCRGKAARDAFTYNGAVGGWVAANNGATPSGGSSLSQTTWTGTTYYIDGVTLTTPSSGTRTFAITVPNGSSETITFNFSVDANGNTTIT